MIILREVKQIEDKIKEIFNLESFSQVMEFIEKNFSEEYAGSLINKNISLHNKIKEVEELSEFVFQLQNYMPALHNIMLMLLITKNYESVFYFVKKLFVGQVGAIRYTSTNGTYNFIERYFDRFIEIVKNCNVDRTLFLPLILNCFEAESDNILYNWKKPSIEYMQSFFYDNEKWTIEYINKNLENKYKLLEIISDFNTNRGVKMTIDDYLLNENTDKEKNTHILKKYKRDTFLELEKKYREENEINKIRIIEIVNSFGTDVEAKSRLQDLYEIETNETVKKYIGESIGITQTIIIETAEEFIKSAHENVSDPQERSLGLPFDKVNLIFKNGDRADNYVYTYIINLFKNLKTVEKIKELNFLFNIFDIKSLNEFSKEIFGKLKLKYDIKEAKWAIRMCALLSDDEYIRDICDFNKWLYNCNRDKEGRYLLECLIYAGRKDAIYVLGEVMKKNNDESYAELFSVLSGMSDILYEELQDMSVPEEYNEKIYHEQKDRLYKAFINGRIFDKDYFFDFYIKHKLFKIFAEKLVWGEYRYGRLHNAFIVKDYQKIYLYKSTMESDSDVVIGIIHPLDCDVRFEKISYAIEHSLFDQFKKSRFNVNEFSSSKVYVNRFCGVIVNVSNFVSKLKEKGFRINKFSDENMFSSMMAINEDLGIACLLDFEKTTSINDEYVSLGFVTYHRKKDLIHDNGKFLTTKSDAIGIGAIPYRYFDFTMSSIFDSYSS